MTDEPPDAANEPPVPEAPEPPKVPAGNALSRALQSGGGAGRFDGMEPRIASIEAHVDHIRDDIGDIRLDLREAVKSVISVGNDMHELDSRISRLPGRGWITVTLLVAAAAICAVIIYLEQIRQYLSILPPTTLSP